jgi:hypothetical protein
MKKEKRYPRHNVSAEGIRRANDKFLSMAESRSLSHSWEVSIGDAMWTFDSVEEFIADYKPEVLFQYISTILPTQQLRQEQLIISRKFPTVPLSVTVESSTRERIQELFNIMAREKLALEGSKGPFTGPTWVRG